MLVTSWILKFFQFWTQLEGCNWIGLGTDH